MFIYLLFMKTNTHLPAILQTACKTFRFPGQLCICSPRLMLCCDNLARHCLVFGIVPSQPWCGHIYHFSNPTSLAFESIYVARDTKYFQQISPSSLIILRYKSNSFQSHRDLTDHGCRRKQKRSREWLL